ncbi:MAG: hypothetical protein AAGG57_12115 [Pseudomonadota bacterium]
MHHKIKDAKVFNLTANVLGLLRERIAQAQAIGEHLRPIFEDFIASSHGEKFNSEDSMMFSRWEDGRSRCDLINSGTSDSCGEWQNFSISVLPYGLIEISSSHGSGGFLKNGTKNVHTLGYGPNDDPADVSARVLSVCMCDVGYTLEDAFTQFLNEKLDIDPVPDAAADLAPE